jgi:hypothetical protein
VPTDDARPDPIDADAAAGRAVALLALSGGGARPSTREGRDVFDLRVALGRVSDRDVLDAAAAFRRQLERGATVCQCGRELDRLADELLNHFADAATAVLADPDAGNCGRASAALAALDAVGRLLRRA